MRFVRILPEKEDDLKQEVLRDPALLAPGLRALSTSVPIGKQTKIDLLAVDERGTPVIALFCLEAGAEEVGLVLEQWEWAASNLPALRGLIGVEGVDATAAPRLMIIASAATEPARRLARRIRNPWIEIFEVTLLEGGEMRGLLVEPAPRPSQVLAEGSGADPVLGTFPPGPARSLMRRILEELGQARPREQAAVAAATPESVDILVGDQPIASLVGREDGVEVRRFDGLPRRRVTGDRGCREAVSFLLEAASPAGARPAGWKAGEPQRATAASLSREELEEFRRIHTRAGKGAVDAGPLPARSPGTGFMEN